MKGGVFGEKCPRDVLLGSDSLILHENYSLGARQGSKKLKMESKTGHKARGVGADQGERDKRGDKSRRKRKGVPHLVQRGKDSYPGVGW